MKPSARHRAREFALQGLYQWQISGNDVVAIEKHLAEVSGFDKADDELFATLLRGAIKSATASQEMIAPLLDRPFAELSPVERGILLLAAFELHEQIATPYRVIINEAIELAKSYGGADGHKYVNGVLDKLAAKLRVNEVAQKAAAAKR